jgi:hypothetical protein
MPEYEFCDVYVPRGVSRKAATRLLTDHAEYGHWELDRPQGAAAPSDHPPAPRHVVSHR